MCSVRVTTSMAVEVASGWTDAVPHQPLYSELVTSGVFMRNLCECDAGGQASVMINGRSIAMSSATSIAQAYVTAVSTAQECDGCESTAQVVAEQSEELLLNAVAIAEVRVNTMTTAGMSRELWIAEFVESVIQGVASAFAEVRMHARHACP